MFVERVDNWQVIGDNFAAAAVTELANLLARLGYHEGAASLYGSVSSGAEPATAARLSPFIPTVRDMMGHDAFDEAYNAGARLSPQVAGERAHQLIAQARADHAAKT